MRIMRRAIAAAALLVAGASAAEQGSAEPKAYIVAQLTVKDPAKFAEYAPQVQATLDPFGGRYLARGGALVPVEGTPPGTRVVILEFPSVDAAKAFNASPAYRAIAPLRHAAAEGPVFIVEGVKP